MFTLYLKPGCPYCQESKELILKYKLKYEFITIDDPEKRELLKKQNNMATFPQIFYKINNKKHKIGGNDDLKKKINHCIRLGNSINNNIINTDLNITLDIFKKKQDITTFKKSKIYKKLDKFIKITD